MSLPYLPGYRLDKKPKQQHNKSHIFDLKNGLMEEPGFVNQPIVEVDYPKGFEEEMKENTRRTDVSAVLSSVPSWVEYDRKVLRFFCYFKEAVFSSQVEKFRVRKCTLYYYLEDDTVHFAEPKSENSGLPQGVLIKRHRVPKDDNSMLTLMDLQIGNELCIYGRYFYICDADGFTREFYEKHGTVLNAPIEIPVDEFTAKSTIEKTSNKKQMYPMKEHMEAALGKPMGTNIEKTQKFLANDNKVLRFYVLHDDEKLYGEKRPFVLRFYLGDDTVDVAEVKDANCSRDAFPMYLNRCKLPKNFLDKNASVSNIGSTDDSTEYYTPADLRIGAYVTVYGRKLLICGCDTFTQQYYIDTHGLSDADFPMEMRTFMDIPEEKFYMKAPESMLYGTEEDSLGSFVFLNPKIPKADYRSLLENEGIQLRFLAKFVKPSEIDEDRTFIISYFMSDNTIQVFENFSRNSGFIGGKFLERSRQMNADTGAFFVPSDFKPGKTNVINGYTYILTQVDAYTEKFIANNPELFVNY